MGVFGLYPPGASGHRGISGKCCFYMMSGVIGVVTVADDVLFSAGNGRNLRSNLSLTSVTPITVMMFTVNGVTFHTIKK
jgi:hypothetical protein